MTTYLYNKETNNFHAQNSSSIFLLEMLFTKNMKFLGGVFFVRNCNGSVPIEHRPLKNDAPTGFIFYNRFQLTFN